MNLTYLGMCMQMRVLLWLCVSYYESIVLEELFKVFCSLNMVGYSFNATRHEFEVYELCDGLEPRI